MKIHSNDCLELKIANALSKKGIRFIHESQNNMSRLDFYLPDFDLYLEIKSGYSDRTESQMKSQFNVIVIQGMKSVDFIVSLLTK
jgi:hypothetical protein